MATYDISYFLRNYTINYRIPSISNTSGVNCFFPKIVHNLYLREKSSSTGLELLTFNSPIKVFIILITYLAHPITPYLAIIFYCSGKHFKRARYSFYFWPLLSNCSYNISLCFICFCCILTIFFVTFGHFFSSLGN